MHLILILCTIFCLLFVLYNQNTYEPAYCATDYVHRHDINYMLNYFTPSRDRIGVGYKPLINKGGTMTYNLQLGKNSDAVKSMVLKLLQPYVNLKFVFDSKGPNLCKVTEISGSTSYGDEKGIALGKTSNYTTAPEITIHEFCHSLQMMHELQHPKRDIKFIESAVIAYYKKTAGWTETETRNAILNTFPADKVIFNEFDRSSIMLYAIPGNLIQGGVGIIDGKELSPIDKKWLSNAYGVPPTVVRSLLYSLQKFYKVPDDNNDNEDF